MRGKEGGKREGEREGTGRGVQGGKEKGSQEGRREVKGTDSTQHIYVNLPYPVCTVLKVIPFNIQPVWFLGRKLWAAFSVRCGRLSSFICRHWRLCPVTPDSLPVYCTTRWGHGRFTFLCHNDIGKVHITGG